MTPLARRRWTWTAVVLVWAGLGPVDMGVSWAGTSPDVKREGRFNLKDFKKEKRRVKKEKKARRKKAKTAPKPAVVQPPGKSPPARAGGVQRQVTLGSPYRVKRVVHKSPQRGRIGTEGTWRWRGYLRNESAYRLRDPQRFSKILSKAYVETVARPATGLAFKAAGLFQYDSVFDVTDDYPPAVRQDQQSRAELREAFVDVSMGPVEWRVGKQQVVWGEVVGAFVADQVNARDLREFLLPQLDTIRIPDWAVNLDLSRGDAHLEGVWIPYPEMNRLPLPGAEFGPAPLPLPVAQDETPVKTLRNSQWGVRANTLWGGVDTSVFYLNTWEKSPVYRGVLAPGPTLVPTYERMDLYGGTVSGEIKGVIVKAEMAYFNDKPFNTTNLFGSSPVVFRDQVNVVLGADMTFFDELAGYAQLFQSHVKGDYRDLLAVPDATLRFASLSLRWTPNGKNLEGEVALFSSLDRPDNMFRVGVSQLFWTRWKAGVGVNMFGGVPEGFYGQFKDNDSVTFELEVSF